MRSRAWTAAETEQLRKLVQDGISPARASVYFDRPTGSVQHYAARSGFPFTQIRELKRDRQKKEDAIRAKLGLPRLYR
jgi:hypothetical protein